MGDLYLKGTSFHEVTGVLCRLLQRELSRALPYTLLSVFGPVLPLHVHHVVVDPSVRITDDTEATKRTLGDEVVCFRP